MKVLWISHFVPFPPRGGNLQRSYHLLRILSRETSIDLVTFHRRAARAEQNLDEARTELLRFCRDVSVFRIPNEASRPAFAAGLARNLFEREPYTARELVSAPFRAEIARRLDHGAYDLLHLDTIDLAPYRSLAPSLPAVLNHHNVESALFARRAPYERNRLAGAYLRLQARKLDRFETEWYGRVSVNLFVSESDRALAEKQAPAITARVVPNGVDVAYYRPGPEGREKRIVWVGGLAWFPNRDAVRWLLEAIWPRVRARHPDAILDLVGEAPRGSLPRRPSGEGVALHGFVEDIRPIVARAHVFVVPIRVGGGTRLKILDAMAMGKAIVTTSIGCEGIGTGPSEAMVRADHPDELAEAVSRLLEDPARRRVLGEEARRLAEERFAWESVGERLVAVDRALAGGLDLPPEDSLHG